MVITKTTFIVSLIVVLIIGVLVGALLFPRESRELVNNPDCYADKNYVRNVIQSPDTQPEFTMKNNDARIDGEDCGTDWMTKVCYIQIYNPSINLLKCACWDLNV